MDCFLRGVDDSKAVEGLIEIGDFLGGLNAFCLIWSYSVLTTSINLKFDQESAGSSDIMIMNVFDCKFS